MKQLTIKLTSVITVEDVPDVIDLGNALQKLVKLMQKERNVGKLDKYEKYDVIMGLRDLCDVIADQNGQGVIISVEEVTK